MAPLIVIAALTWRTAPVWNAAFVVSLAYNVLLANALAWVLWLYTLRVLPADTPVTTHDHVDLAQDSVKAHLASKYHEAYDAALREFAASMTNLRSVEANRLAFSLF